METKYYRKFLNDLKSPGTAHVSFNVQLYKSGAVSAYFSVKDCTQEASLEFYVQQAVRKRKPDIENARGKIAILREALDEFERDFEEALVESDKQRKKKRKKK